jgi:hypothetical protein
MFYVCRLDDQGNWHGIRSTTEKAYSEQLFDYFCRLYPSAYLDVLTHEEYCNKELQQAMVIN